MYVKSIVIDGFKSYGKRTEINGFDPSFNAITGLNGSGKSNILDAICFVLGISNLSYVRATSMQDFVYKQGQANVNKATVSVTFDNTDKRQCPPGFEDQKEIVITRQVVIGGKNKYQINGLNVQNNRVQDLFRSVQLNVNNPHFLIMQGRITKVLNMKPLEILSMVEEAAGTRLYKTKKEQSVKTLEKKDLKMEEINRQLREDLEPKIAKLREERQQHQELIKLNRELEQIARVYLAYKFHQAEETCANVEKELQKIIDQIAEFEKAIVDGKAEIAKLDEAIKIMQERKDKEGGSQLKQAEKELTEAEKAHAQLLARDKAAADSVKAVVRHRQQVTKNIATDQDLLKKKETTLEKGRAEYTTMEEQTQKLQTALEVARKRHQAASQGLFVDEQGKASSLQQQLMDAQKAMISAQSETTTLQMKMNPLKQQLKEKKDQLKKTGNVGNDQAELQNLEKGINKLKAELPKLQAAVTQHQEFSARYDDLSRSIRRLEQQINSGLNQYPRAKFHFTDPAPNFDRGLVKGLLCRLFKLKDKNMAAALEAAAGGKLYNVVTTSDEVAKMLIKNKSVTQRVTFMPLNKISSRPLNPAAVRAAQSIVGAENVWFALDLIEYDPQLQTAMESVFGNTLVCRDLKQAKVLPYDQRVRARCVTLDGDVVETFGTLSGGAPSRNKPILAVLAGLQDHQDELSRQQMESHQLQIELNRLEQSVERHQTLQAEYDNKSHQATLLRTRIGQSAHGRLELEVQELETEIGSSTGRLQELQQVEQKATQQHKELETKVKQSKSLAEKEMKASEKEMKQLQAELDKGRQKWEQCEQKFKTLELEIQEMKQTIETAQADLVTTEESIKQKEIELNTGKEELEAAAEQVKVLQAAVSKQKDIINKHNKEMQAKQNRCEQLTTEGGEHELNLKKLRNTKEKVAAENKSAHTFVAKLLAQHDWIAHDRKLFNQPGTQYDFSNMDMDKVKENVSAIEARKKTLEKKTNIQAMTILSKAEDQLKDLLKKKGMVEKDRQQLQLVISELDKKMVEVLQQAWQQINKDFGAIFSTLLKGAEAKLVASSGSNNVLEGLEVKVGFNGKWKDSLGELSGGQRSLVALSLILAMLLFKPAPIYILDEVDAALDPSHTENIGNIIQSHFKQSQFIIVSLKEGMFNNANVLFRTKFVDGMSTVSRNVQKHNSRT